MFGPKEKGLNDGCGLSTSDLHGRVALCGGHAPRRARGVVGLVTPLSEMGTNLIGAPTPTGFHFFNNKTLLLSVTHESLNTQRVDFFPLPYKPGL